MSPTHATRNGTKRYRYYVCNNAQKRGWHNCPSRSIPAGEIERIVVEQIKLAGQDPALLHEVVAQARVQGKSRLEELEAERSSLERELGTGVPRSAACLTRSLRATTTRRPSPGWISNMGADTPDKPAD